MKLKELEGKKVIRTRGRIWESTAVSWLQMGSTSKNIHRDNTYVGEEIEILLVTEQLAYVRRNSRSLTEIVVVLSLADYDDGAWEESLLYKFR